MNKVFWVLASVLLLAYPVLIYFGIEKLSPAHFAAVLAVLMSVRFMLSPTARDVRQVALFTLVLLYVGSVVLSDSQLLLRLYPVLMSLAVASTFFVTLFEPESLIERMARLSGKVITPRAKVYTRKLTAVWFFLLVVNAVVSLFFAVEGSVDAWAFYCGFLSYILFATFFGAEFIYRQFYIRKYGA
ncbi:MAG: hypothetical protein K6L80_00270 [Agarilytica sp.]